jgi:putative ABC transport system permease protein
VARRERARELALLAAIGVSAGQARRAAVLGHAAGGVAAGALGVPAGLAFFRAVFQLANGTSDGAGTPGPLALLAVVAGTAVALAALGGLPAARLRRQSVATALAAD